VLKQVEIIEIDKEGGKPKINLNIIQFRIVDLRYVQEFHSRNSSRTIGIYTHVRGRNIASIKNPLNGLFEKQGGEYAGRKSTG
jgi:hypothetical protein